MDSPEGKKCVCKSGYSGDGQKCSGECFLPENGYVHVCTITLLSPQLPCTNKDIKYA